MKIYKPLVVIQFFSLTLFAQQGQNKLFKTPFPGYDSASNNKYFRQSEAWSIEEYLDFFSEQREYVKYREKDGKGKVQTFRFEGDPIPYLTQEIQQLILTSKKYTSGTDNISKLHNRLDKLYETIKTTAGQTELSVLCNAVFQLPPSLNKINLLIRLSNFKIFNKTYLSDIRFFENKINEVILLLPSDFIKAQAYIQLGNFYNTYYISDMSIEMYYKARQFIYKSRLSQKQKNDYQARICILLSTAFSKDYYAPHISKSNYYYNQAVQYFLSNKDTINVTLNSLRSIANSVFTLDELTKTVSQQEYNHYIKSLFFYLQNWLLFHDESENISTEESYAGTYSIGVLLWKFGKPDPAVNYFTETLVYAIRNKEYGQIKSALSYLSFIYSKTGDALSSRKYADLLALFKESPDKYVLITNAINKAEQLDNFNAHDSAYAVLAALEADTALVNYFYPPVQDGIYEKIYKNKALFLFPIDLFQSYKALNTYYTYRELRKDQFASMLAAESKGIGTWLEDVADNELMLKAELIRAKDENNQILSGKNRLLDILSRLTKDSLILANENRQKDSIYYTDTLAKANKIRELEKKNTIAEQENIKAKARTNYYLLGGVGIFAIGLFFANRYRNKINREKIKHENAIVKYKLQLDKSRAEMKLLSNLAVNHDIDKFIPLLPGYIEKISEQTKPTLKKAVEDFRSYYLLTKHTGNILTNTLKAEMEIARKSANVYRYISRSKTAVSITCNFEGDSLIEHVEIPKNMLTGFIANSVKHGSVGKTAISIDVNVTGVPEGVLVTITDDGAGFEQLYLEERSNDKGINLVMQQVKNYNESNAGTRIIFSPENIKSPGRGQGTIVQFKIISEWKEETLL